MIVSLCCSLLKYNINTSLFSAEEEPRRREFNNTMFHLTETSTTKQMTPINRAITEEGLFLNNQIAKVLNGFHLRGSRWEFSWKQRETVCNIFVLIRFLLSPKARRRPLSGEMELREEKLTADAEELDGSDDCVEEQPVWGWESGGGTTTVEAVCGGFDSRGVCSSTQVNNNEAERLSSKETYFLTSQPDRKHVRV